MIIQKWKQCGTRAQGKDHINAGVVCQDNVAALSRGGVHAIALSEGGGSRKYSEVGSACSTAAACRLLVEKFDEYYDRLDEIDAAEEGKAAKLLLSLRLEILDVILGALRAEVTAEKTLRDFGCTLQFAAVAWNLMKNGKAVYIETGAWSKKAIAEAKKYGEVIVAASSKDKNYSYIPDCSDLDIPEDTDYVYICENETIHGVTWSKLPNTKGHVLVSDQSSMFLSKPCNVSDYGMIYAGVQKNVGPAGMVVVIIREDLIREDIDPKMPVYMSYKTHADNGSMYNTPNCWAIYCCGKVFKYLKSIGGLEEMHKRNIAKAKVIYDFLDSSKMFKGTVEPEFRSLMNIPFVTESAELDAEVVAATKAAGYDNLKGHKSVGGLRASVYNAMPIEGAQALVEFLTKFEAEHN